MRGTAGISGALALAAVVLTGCSAGAVPLPPPTATPVAPSGDGVLRIGALLPLTGDLRNEGRPQSAGIELALREINEAGGFSGVPLELVLRDSGATVQAASAAFADLAHAGADVVIGPSADDLAEALVPAAEAARIPLVSPTGAGRSSAYLAGVSRVADDAPSAWDPDAAFLARLTSSDPGLDYPRTGAEAYDAAVLAVLAAVAAHDDGGRSIASQLSATAAGGEPCGSFGECAAALDEAQDISYGGVTGTVRTSVAG